MQKKTFTLNLHFPSSMLSSENFAEENHVLLECKIKANTRMNHMVEWFYENSLYTDTTKTFCWDLLEGNANSSNWGMLVGLVICIFFHVKM